MGLCAGCVRAMLLLVLRHGGQGVKRGLVGLQRLQLETVIITLRCELRSGVMHVMMLIHNIIIGARR